MGEIQPFMCKTAKQTFVGLQVTNNRFSKFHFKDIIRTGGVVLQLGTAKKIMDDRTGKIQLFRRYMVQVFVGLQVSNGSFPRFHLREYT